MHLQLPEIGQDGVVDASMTESENAGMELAVEMAHVWVHLRNPVLMPCTLSSLLASSEARRRRLIVAVAYGVIQHVAAYKYGQDQANCPEHRLTTDREV